MIIERFDGTRLVLMINGRRLQIDEAETTEPDGAALLNYQSGLGNVAPVPVYDLDPTKRGKLLLRCPS